MALKYCPRCRKRKNKKSFKANGGRYDGLQGYCAVCDKKRTAKWYSDNSEIEIAKRLQRKKENTAITRKYVYKFLLTHPCVDCGETDPVVLDFDHLGDKDNNVCTALINNWRVDRIQKEIAKCAVRCANCHRRKTSKQFNWWKLDHAELAHTVERETVDLDNKVRSLDSVFGEEPVG